MNIFKQFAYVHEDENHSVDELFPTRKVSKESSSSISCEKIVVISDEHNEKKDSMGSFAVKNFPLPGENFFQMTPSHLEEEKEEGTGFVGLKELYKSPSQDKECVLKLLIVGHNPSHQSYSKGHYYANPVNRFWSLMKKGAMIPTHYSPNHDQDCPTKLQIGFTDVAWNYCETKSANLSDQFLYENCRQDFYKRLIEHVNRVHHDHPQIPLSNCAPKIIAFTGVRQWKALFPSSHPIQKMNIGQNREKRKKEGEEEVIDNIHGSSFDGDSKDVEEIGDEKSDDQIGSRKKMKKERNSTQKNNLHTFLSLLSLPAQSSYLKGEVAMNAEPVQYGIQTLKPPDWPTVLKQSVIFLLPSPSGAAAMSNEQREAPYIELGKLYRDTALTTEPELIQSSEERSHSHEIVAKSLSKELSLKATSSITVIDLIDT